MGDKYGHSSIAFRNLIQQAETVAFYIIAKYMSFVPGFPQPAFIIQMQPIKINQ